MIAIMLMPTTAIVEYGVWMISICLPSYRYSAGAPDTRSRAFPDTPPLGPAAIRKIGETNAARCARSAGGLILGQ